MKAMSTKISKNLPTGAELVCADNTGAKKLQIISVRNIKTRRKMQPTGGIGNVVMCRVLIGTEKVMHQVFRAIIIRQRKEYKRANGIRICFEDNAAVIVNEKHEPQGKLIKGPVAKEAVERFPAIGKIASVVV
ncbi:MAG: uL14 family ribosomal protein [Candidatus Aenigmarchaeota archaeon]|nr:uL14 family ribosomal protein [Candidatus Aenigmarchaeota archaeon]